MHEIEIACEIITGIEAKKAEIMTANTLSESDFISKLKTV
jgi:hypothetical protein